MNEEMQDAINKFNEVSKNAGTIAFKVKYTAIPSNQKIHKDFAQFCYDESNNSYIGGLNLLMKYKDIFDYLVKLNERVSETEHRLESLRDILYQMEEKYDGKENQNDEERDSGRKTF